MFAIDSVRKDYYVSQSPLELVEW